MVTVLGGAMVLRKFPRHSCRTGGNYQHVFHECRGLAISRWRGYRLRDGRVGLLSAASRQSGMERVLGRSRVNAFGVHAHGHSPGDSRPAGDSNIALASFPERASAARPLYAGGRWVDDAAVDGG